MTDFYLSSDLTLPAYFCLANITPLVATPLACNEVNLEWLNRNVSFKILTVYVRVQLLVFVLFVADKDYMLIVIQNPSEWMNWTETNVVVVKDIISFTDS